MSDELAQTWAPVQLSQGRYQGSLLFRMTPVWDMATIRAFLTGFSLWFGVVFSALEFGGCKRAGIGVQKTLQAHGCACSVFREALPIALQPPFSERRD